MRSDTAHIRFRLVVTMLVVSLMLTGAGGVLCFATDGRVAYEAFNPLLPCPVGACDDVESIPAPQIGQPELTECSDLVIPGLVTVRNERPADETVVVSPLIDCFAGMDWDTPIPTSFLCFTSYDRPPNTQNVKALNSVVILV